MNIRSLTIAVALAMAAAQSGSADAAGQATSYTNARFGYSISYPAEFLVPEREADNGDGRAFHPRRGTGKMSVWGANRDQDSEATPVAIAHLYETDCGQGKTVYELIKPNLVAFSCISRSGEIIYQKTLVGQDVLRSVRFDYPYSDRATWDPLVKLVSGSLHTIGG